MGHSLICISVAYGFNCINNILSVLTGGRGGGGPSVSLVLLSS